MGAYVQTVEQPALRRADDAMAILAAFNWPEVEVLGLTTLFGNVPTDMATDNALILRDLAQTSNGEGAPRP